jgi:DNA (cytosine-5)-methyltransferase 1
MKHLKVISLFAGCGGSDLGIIGGFDFLGKKYKKLPVSIVHASDYDKSAVDTYNKNFNHSAVCCDVRALSSNSLPDCDVVLGGFPCQSFSTVNPTKNTNDARANLYKEMLRIVSEKLPMAFIAENVKGMMTLEKGTIMKRILSDFESIGYNVKFKLLNAADYGIPQRRERVFIVGIRSDINVEFEFPKPVLSENATNSWVPLNKIVTKLKIEDSKYYFSKRAVEGMKNAKPNMKRGLFQDLNKPCLTITSHLAKVSLNSRDPVLLVNPEEELYRRFTVKEAAGIQSFPEQFEFPVSDHQAYKQIGNAIPPVLMWHVSSALTELLISKFKK